MNYFFNAKIDLFISRRRRPSLLEVLIGSTITLLFVNRYDVRENKWQDEPSDLYGTKHKWGHTMIAYKVITL